MCGPSQAMKNLNTMVQNFATTAGQNAQQIFGQSSQIFNTMWGGLKNILTGGPSQWGYSTGQTQAMNAANAQAAATLGRNLKAAAAASGAAVGGGNVVSPAGATIAATTAAEQTAAAEQAQGANAIIQSGYAQGNQNYWKAAGAAQQLPGIYGTALTAQQNYGSDLTQAQTSQQEMDTQNNWWKGDLIKGAAVAANFIPGVGPLVSKEIASMANNPGVGVNSGFQGFQGPAQDSLGSGPGSAPSGFSLAPGGGLPQAQEDQLDQNALNSFNAANTPSAGSNLTGGGWS